MWDPLHRRNRVALWYESGARPEGLLVGIVLLLYVWSLPGGFVIDDFRNIELMRAYHEGRRPTLELYRFLRGDEDNRRLREAGYYPWWVADDVRYQHARPLAERFLYAQYLLFGDRPLGYRLVSLAMYALGVLLTLRLFRIMAGDERTARWAALIFAVAACHAAPVNFISMQCDLLGLLLIGGALVAAAQYAQRGGRALLAGAALLYALALCAKESSLPAAILPLLMLTARGGEASARRRALVCTVFLTAIGAGWLGYYAVGGYGSNNAMMLDPLHAPADYLSHLPRRAAVLLSTWLIPFNPFFFYLRPFGRTWQTGLAAIGVLSLLLMIWLSIKGGRRAAASTLWALVFLPLLACTVPDDRNLLLPSVGFALLGAIWMSRPRRDGSQRLRKLPLLLFVIAQLPAGAGVAWAFRKMEATTGPVLQSARAGFDRPLRPADRIFFVNAAYDWQILFGQYCLDWLNGGPGPRASFLCDIRNPEVRRVDERTLRIEGREEPILAGFLGAMGRTRSHIRTEGEEYDAGEYRVRIARMQGGEIWAVEVRFVRDLDDDAYRFYWCHPALLPDKWAVPRFDSRPR